MSDTVSTDSKPVTESKRVLSGLNSREYEHPLDRQTLSALERTPGLPQSVKKLSEIGLDRIMRVQFTGSYLKISESAFTEMHDALIDACKTLDMGSLPDYYMNPEYTVNALTTGVTRPLVCVTTGCIDQLTRGELLFILGHELGHIKSQHVMYHQMAQIAPILAEIIGAATLGIGGVVGTSLQVALLNWARKSEFTADRAGLLTCQDIEVATTALMKMAGVPSRHQDKMNHEHFVEQAREFEGIDEGADKVWKALSIMFAEHPWLVMRAAELQKWIDSGDYDRVLNRQTELPALRPTTFCTKCGNGVDAIDKFCRKCGNQI